MLIPLQGMEDTTESFQTFIAPYENSVKKIVTVLVIPVLQTMIQRGAKLLLQTLMAYYLSDDSNPNNEKFVALLQGSDSHN